MAYKDLRKGRHSQVHQEYFITTVCNNRTAIFEDFYISRLFIKEMMKLEKEGNAEFLAWVVMPDHFHVLLRLNGNEKLASIMQKLKGRASIGINRILKRKGKLWQEGFYDHALRKEENRKGIARYIVGNPLRAGLVTKIGDYPHWDSVWLE